METKTLAVATRGWYLNVCVAHSPARGRTRGFDPEGLAEVQPQRAQIVVPAIMVPNQQGQGPRLHTLDPASSNRANSVRASLKIKN